MIGGCAASDNSWIERHATTASVRRPRARGLPSASTRGFNSPSAARDSSSSPRATEPTHRAPPESGASPDDRIRPAPWRRTRRCPAASCRARDADTGPGAGERESRRPFARRGCAEGPTKPSATDASSNAHARMHSQAPRRPPARTSVRSRRIADLVATFPRSSVSPPSIVNALSGP